MCLDVFVQLSVNMSYLCVRVLNELNERIALRRCITVVTEWYELCVGE